jgi:hypothetical protein
LARRDPVDRFRFAAFLHDHQRRCRCGKVHQHCFGNRQPRSSGEHPHHIIVHKFSLVFLPVLLPAAYPTPPSKLYHKAEYFIGRIGPARFEINSGVGGMFGATLSFAGDCYAVLSTAQTVGEAKRFCEWVARGYGLDRTPLDKTFRAC